jgi:hypothetical protein
MNPKATLVNLVAALPSPQFPTGHPRRPSLISQIFISLAGGGEALSKKRGGESHLRTTMAGAGAQRRQRPGSRGAHTGLASSSRDARSLARAAPAGPATELAWRLWPGSQRHMQGQQLSQPSSPRRLRRCAGWGSTQDHGGQSGDA